MTNTIEWWWSSVKEQGAVYFPGGKSKVAPEDLADVAAVAALSLTQPEHRNQVCELTGPDLLSIAEMVQILSHSLGRSLQYVGIPPIAAKLWMLKSGMDKALVNALMEMLATLRKNQAAICTGTFEQLTGYEPHSFAAWCESHIAAFQA